MGVEFLVCDSCGDTFADCGEYVSCYGEHSEEHPYLSRHWCSEQCAEKAGYEWADNPDDATCSYCRKEKAEDLDLFKFLLRKFKLKRKDVEKEYLNGKF
jgi:hypothetical protein